MSLPIIYTAALIVAAFFAAMKGSEEARWIAVAYLIEQVIGLAVDERHWAELKISLFVFDVVLLGMLIWIIVKGKLVWPIALGVLQTLTVLGHCARLAAPTMSTMGYFVLLQWTAWPAFLAIVVGTTLDWRAGRTSAGFWRMRRLRTRKPRPST